MDELAKQLQEKLSSNEPYLSELVFPNYKKKDKENMTEALVFWQELRRQLARGFYQKEDIASLFELKVAKSNPFISTIIMIESLPTSVWRALLWKENLDFMSHESFLRRLNKEQKTAIKENYSDWQGKKVPRVLKKGLRSKIKVKLGLISYEKLKNEDYDYEARHTNKAAWAYNLLGLDFGFCLYPKGESSDEKIENKSFTRFLSRKDHVNDFIVNEEDGKYFYMYKTARSNYAIRPNKEVEISTHICPGFWYTLIVHTLFWIVSPIALISTGLTVWQFGLSWETISPAIFALPMLIWTLFACLRLIKNSIVNFFKLIRSIRADHWAIKILKKIIIVISFTFLTLILSLITYYFFAVTIPNYFSLMTPILGPLLSTLTLLSLLFYLIFLMSYLYNIKKLYNIIRNKVPEWIKVTSIFSLVAAAVVLIDTFISHHVIYLVIYLTSQIWSWFITDILVNSWLIIAGAFIVINIFFINIFEKDEEKFVRQCNLMLFSIKIFALLTIGFFLAFWLREGALTLNEIGHATAFLLAFSVIAIAIYLLMTSTVNKKTIKKRNKIRSFLQVLFGDSDKKALFKRLAAGKINEDLELYDKIAYLTIRLFYNCKIREKFIVFIFNLPVKKIQKIIDHQTELLNERVNKGNFQLKDSIESEEVYIIFVINYLIKDGYTLEKAVAKANDEINIINDKYKKTMARKNQEKAMVYKNLTKLVSPFVWFGNKVYRLFATLNYLWAYFNQICPYKTEKKVLY
jgi:hypothetical protein